jgi:hypothetical protein
MPTYAQNTTVTSEASRAEIERTIARYGAEGFSYGWNPEAAMVEFAMKGRRIRFILQLPDKGRFARTERRRQLRSPKAAEEAFEKAVRQRWRALALVIKAKLEAVEAEISEFEQEFLGNIVLPNGTTVGEFMVPQIQQVYATGEMPPMLPQLESGS